jgi:dipeptidyl aminopeptidase/acylaminoacyl peptidase
VQDFLGGSPSEVPERYASASPFERLPLGVPQVLIHGEDDAAVPIELSERYVRAAEAAGDAAHLIRLPNTGHFEVIDPSSAVWHVVLRSVQSMSDTLTEIEEA